MASIIKSQLLLAFFLESFGVTLLHLFFHQYFFVFSSFFTAEKPGLIPHAILM